MYCTRTAAGTRTPYLQRPSQAASSPACSLETLWGAVCRYLHIPCQPSTPPYLLHASSCAAPYLHTAPAAKQYLPATAQAVSATVGPTATGARAQHTISVLVSPLSRFPSPARCHTPLGALSCPVLFVSPIHCLSFLSGSGSSSQAGLRLISFFPLPLPPFPSSPLPIHRHPAHSTTSRRRFPLRLSTLRRPRVNALCRDSVFHD